MSAGSVHDVALLDLLESITPVVVDAVVWRITRAGADPLKGSSTNGRWSPEGSAEVLYTSLERDGALAEIGFRLGLEPVWPSRLQHDIHELRAMTKRTLRFADVGSLTPFGVDATKYAGFDYAATRALAAAAHFLEFDGLLVPSARHPSHNLVIFTEFERTAELDLLSLERVDWASWRGVV